jgi:hypothetical protein
MVITVGPGLTPGPEKGTSMRKPLLLIGILIACMGWFLNNAERFPFVYNVIAPQYMKKMALYQQMRQKGHVLQKGGPAFPVALELLDDFITHDGKKEIIRIKTLDSAMGLVKTTEGPRWYNYMELQVTYTTPPHRYYTFHNFDKLIQVKYLTLYVHTWSSVLFWIGILMCLLSLFLSNKRTANK